MAWYLNPALTRMRAEVNARWPRRDRTSDGTIGDAAHQASVSDHNPDSDGSVDAWDMDVDGVDVEFIKARFQRHPAARYWIHNRQIASRDIDNWRRRAYTGANPHDKHVHWNTREGYENSTAPWGIEEDDMFEAEDRAKLNNLYSAVFLGGPSCGLEVAPANGRNPGNSLINKADAAILRPQVEAAPVDPAALKAVILDPEVLAAIAAAINDDAAARMTT